MLQPVTGCPYHCMGVERKGTLLQKRGIIEMQMLMFALALVAASTQVRAQGRHPCDLTAQP